MEANQLKATELRPFNMLKVKGDSKDYYQVMAIDAINDKVYLNIPRNNWHDISKLKPIPLTEDILVKLGFEIDSVDRPILHADYKVINPITHDYMIELKNVGTGWFYRNGYFKIDYVHQFQNLYFALCGEELTFKN